MTSFSDLLAGLEASAQPAEAPIEAPIERPEVVCTAALESIGHLRKKIESIWASPELDGFVSGLFVDSRDGERRGLPLDVAEELVFLVKINKMIRAMDSAARLNIGLREAYRLVDEGDQSRLEAAQRPVAPKPAAAASARKEPQEGVLVAPGRGPSDSGSRLVIYLVVALIGGILLWLWRTGAFGMLGK